MPSETEDTDPTPEEIKRRVAWFERYTHALEYESVSKPKVDGFLYGCPCCGFRTLAERGGYDIYPVCFWEDDGQDDANADTVRGGPNGAISLTQARKNFKAFGACDTKCLPHVRKPTAGEE